VVTLDHFHVFAIVAKHRNVSRASEELHISQPAVTTQLKLLGENYHVKLYKRGGAGIELTDAGRIFLKYAKTTLKQHEKLKQKLSAAASGTTVESLTVGGSHSPSMSLLLSLLTIFKRRHPRVQVNLRTNNRTTIERQVENSEVEIAVVNKSPRSRFLLAEPYLDEPLVAFISKKHPLARKSRPTLKDFADIPLVVREGKGGRETSKQILKDLRKQGLNFEIGIRCESPEAVKMAVRSNLGAGILFKNTVEPEIRKGDFKPIRLPGLRLVGKTFIIYHKHRPLSSSAHEFLNLLREMGRSRRVAF
jgi:DNA-binding transcriptional LysR family regulator